MYEEDEFHHQVYHVVIAPEIEDAIQDFVLDDATYVKVTELMLEHMNKGLAKGSNPSAILKMLITYVRGLPDGTERGHFLALDLGGTNFRVLLITLKGREFEMKNKIYPISEELMLGKGTSLFDHIASCIASFMKEHNLSGQKLPLGFTFSFPCKQEGLAVGRLITWTKGFCCEGVEGEDVVRLLHEAIERRGDIKGVECVAVLNDTVGCLMSCAFTNHDCQIGVILGTGTNACYMEKLDRVETWDGDSDKPRQVVINTEWGAFGDDGCLDFLRTEADREIDDSSLNPGKQTYEKMISGMYMGEIARLAIVKCVKKGLIFGGELTEELNTPHKFHTKYISEVETDDHETEFLHTRQVLEELGYEEAHETDCGHVQFICAAVSRRAAFLASSGIATLLNRIGDPNVTVAVDGSLYRYHPHFHTLMTEKIEELLKPGLKFSLMLSEDGSGKGAALVAAVANRLHREASQSSLQLEQEQE